MNKKPKLYVYFLSCFFVLSVVFFGYITYGVQQYLSPSLDTLSSSESLTQEQKNEISTGIEPLSRKWILSGVPREQALYLAVTEYVPKIIAYNSDLRQYGMVEHLPTPEMVYSAKSDDCDGIALLSTAILRMYGVSSARVATNNNHAAVSLNSNSLPPTQLHIANVYDMLPPILSRIASFPWLRLGGAIIALAMALRPLTEKRYLKPDRFWLVVLLLGASCIMLEAFSREYLKVNNVEGITISAWLWLLSGSLLLTVLIVSSGQKILTAESKQVQKT